MNFLAHAYLSFQDPACLTGNMISDFVKGRAKLDLPLSIQKGIRLHRAIDQFTDDHIICKEAANLFKKEYGRYAPAVVDVVFDHFLSISPNHFPEENDLMGFSLSVYHQLETNEAHFPERFKTIFPYMKKQNWLYNYRFDIGVKNSLEGLVRRAAYLSNAQPAIEIVYAQHEQLNQYFEAFFPSLYEFSQKTFQKIRQEED